MKETNIPDQTKTEEIYAVMGRILKYKNEIRNLCKEEYW